MPLIVRNTITKEKTVYPSWDENAFEKVLSARKYKTFHNMQEYHYTDSEGNEEEVYCLLKDLKISAVKQLSGIPKLDCLDISPADMTLLHVFQHTIGSTADVDEAKTHRQRFVLKQKWYRLIDSTGKDLKVQQEDLTKYLTSESKIDIEYHMNYARLSYTTDNVVESERHVFGDPLVRKIILKDCI